MQQFAQICRDGAGPLVKSSLAGSSQHQPADLFCYRLNDNPEKYGLFAFSPISVREGRRQDKRRLGAAQAPASRCRQPRRSGLAQSGWEHDQPQQRSCRKPCPDVVRLSLSLRGETMRDRTEFVNIRLAPLDRMHEDLDKVFVCTDSTITRMHKSSHDLTVANKANAES